MYERLIGIASARVKVYLASQGVKKAVYLANLVLNRVLNLVLVLGRLFGKVSVLVEMKRAVRFCLVTILMIERITGESSA